MSGGSLEYLCYGLEDIPWPCSRSLLHRWIIHCFLQVWLKLLHDLEWTASGDYGEVDAPHFHIRRASSELLQYQTEAERQEQIEKRGWQWDTDDVGISHEDYDSCECNPATGKVDRICAIYYSRLPYPDFTNAFDGHIIQNNLDKAVDFFNEYCESEIGSHYENWLNLLRLTCKNTVDRVYDPGLKATLIRLLKWD